MTLRARLRLGAVRPTSDWLARFQSSSLRPPVVPWSDASLTAQEQADVIPSIQQFQRGESSAGHNLRRVAARYARRVRDSEYLPAIEAFIAQEQAHAGWLGRYLDAVGAPRLPSGLLDRVFRRLRKLGGIETAIAVLLTAELIAKVYYRALRDATRCPALRAVCERILEDERAHVEFHSERLFLMRCMRPSRSNQACLLLQRMLFAATVPAVWLAHRRPFRRAGTSYLRYQAAAWREFQAACAVITGDAQPDPFPLRPREAVGFKPRYWRGVAFAARKALGSNTAASAIAAATSQSAPRNPMASAVNPITGGPATNPK